MLRDRIGEREDRFFAAVFLGRGLLFVGMMFAAAATAGAVGQAHDVVRTAWLGHLGAGRNVTSSLLARPAAGVDWPRPLPAAPCHKGWPCPETRSAESEAGSTAQKWPRQRLTGR
jgi:hypothetical protein